MGGLSIVFYYHNNFHNTLKEGIAQFAECVRCLWLGGSQCRSTVPGHARWQPKRMETLRTVLPKNEGVTGRQNLGMKGIGSSAASGTKSVTGCGVKFTFDVPQGKHNGVMDVKVCWHNIVYQAQVDFGVKFLIYKVISFVALLVLI